MSYTDQLMGANEHPVFITRKHWFFFVGKSIQWVLLAAVSIALVVLINYLAGYPSIIPETFRTRFAAGVASLIASILVVTAMIGLIFEVLRWQAGVFIITNRRVIHIVGVLNKTSIDSSLEKINDVRLEQSWLGRIFNFGTLAIVTGSDIGINLMQNIARPITFKTTLVNEKEKLQDEERLNYQHRQPGGYGYPHMPVPPYSALSQHPARGNTAAMPIQNVPQGQQPPTIHTAATRPQPVVASSPAPYNQKFPVPPANAEILHLIDSLKALYDAGVLTEQEFQTKKAELLSRL